MGHVDDAHQSEDECEAARDDEERAREGERVEHDAQERAGSWTAEPNVVVRQPPLPISGGVFVMKRMYARAKSTTAATTTRGARRQIERRSNMRSACALTEAT